ncbi:FixH family protein [Thalassobacillus devorans]|uniref:FixH family protein n=1 Tax=Thalassobacillus devorans TaxID=279813 RepID=UPI0004B709BD|nr:FixH family protein [Thalassobacillus devorans]
MKKTLIYLGLFITAIVLSACGGDQSGNAEEEKGMEPMLDTKVTIPEDIQPNEEVTFQAKVTQGEEAVEDADYVKFEFWAEGASDEEHEKVEAEHKGKGVYEVSYTFEEEGAYYLFAHTQARDMHVMPKKKFPVGDVQITEDKKEDDDMEGNDDSH